MQEKKMVNNIYELLINQGFILTPKPHTEWSLIRYKLTGEEDECKTYTLKVDDEKSLIVEVTDLIVIIYVGFNFVYKNNLNFSILTCDLNDHSQILKDIDYLKNRNYSFDTFLKKT